MAARGSDALAAGVGRTYDDRIDATIPYPDPPLGTSTFVLRRFGPGDFDAAKEFGRDPATALWVPPLPAEDPGEVVELFEQYRTSGEMLHLVIAAVGTDDYLGEVMVAVGEHRVGEFGCGVVSDGRGRGIATEALRLLTRWSAAVLNLARLQVLVAETNEPALRLAERVGFRREGLLRAYWGNDESRFDVVMLSMLPEEMPAQ